jgi:hypothetical protein
MNVTFNCPRCERPARAQIAGDVQSIPCPACDGRLSVPADAVADGRVGRCLVCPGTELFVRKDFPQKLGVTLVVVGFAASCVAWYFHWIYATFGILFATAAIDVVLYAVMGNALICYRCGAQYRQVAGLDEHAPFSLETHERYRQQAARLEQATASSPR